jgi:hypothetical protein
MKVDYPNIYVETEFTITGRGLVLVTDQRFTGHSRNLWTTSVPYKIGQTLTYEGKLYKITSVETQSNLMNGKFASRSGLLVKEIENEEMD